MHIWIMSNDTVSFSIRFRCVACVRHDTKKINIIQTYTIVYPQRGKQLYALRLSISFTHYYRRALFASMTYFVSNREYIVHCIVQTRKFYNVWEFSFLAFHFVQQKSKEINKERKRERESDSIFCWYFSFQFCEMQCFA